VISLLKRFLLVLLISFFVVACGSKQDIPIRNILMVDLLITKKDMPVGWKVDFPAGNFISGYYAEEAVAIVFIPEIGVRRATGQDIYRFSNPNAAKHKLHNEFIPEVWNSGEFIPADWVPPRLSVDEEKFVCYWKAVDIDPEKFMLCVWTARYDEFIVTFNSWVLPDLMSLDEIKSIIIKIDQKFAHQLGR
jgi:hypothetical protein